MVKTEKDKIIEELINWKHERFDDDKGNNHFKKHLLKYDLAEDIDELLLSFGEHLLQSQKQKIIKEIRELPNPMMCDWNNFIKWKQKLLNSLGERQ